MVALIGATFRVAAHSDDPKARDWVWPLMFGFFAMLMLVGFVVLWALYLTHNDAGQPFLSSLVVVFAPLLGAGATCFFMLIEWPRPLVARFVPVPLAYTDLLLFMAFLLAAALEADGVWGQNTQRVWWALSVPLWVIDAVWMLVVCYSGAAFAARGERGVRLCVLQQLLGTIPIMLFQVMLFYDLSLPPADRIPTRYFVPLYLSWVLVPLQVPALAVCRRFR